jgi:hypothetical protein
MSLHYSDEFGWSGQQNMTLQKYLILQSQHEAVQEYLDQLRSSAVSTATTSANTSPSMSPTRESSRKHHSRSSHRRSLPPPSSRHSHTLETVIDETTLHEIAAQEQQLFDVSEAMKRSLTELLNSDTVRADRTYRMWVQTRLMEVERALRSGRRRRSH